MILYIKIYQLTFLRVFVLWALIVISLLVAGALIMIYKKDFPLVKYYVVTVTVLYIIFSFSHPDYFIARYNLDHSYIATYGEDNEVISYSLAENRDLYYLRGLSLDAAPAIFDKMEEIEENTGLDVYRDLSYDYWRWYELYAGKIIRNSYDGNLGYPLEDYHYPKKMSLRKFNFSKWTAYRRYTNYYDSHPFFAAELNSVLSEY